VTYQFVNDNLSPNYWINSKRGKIVTKLGFVSARWEVCNLSPETSCEIV
jgi:hypothetical protein